MSVIDWLPGSPTWTLGDAVDEMLSLSSSLPIIHHQNDLFDGVVPIDTEAGLSMLRDDIYVTDNGKQYLMTSEEQWEAFTKQALEEVAALNQLCEEPD